MRHGTAALVVLFAILFVHPLQEDPPVPQRRVIGLVDIPRLLAHEEPGSRPREVAVNLFQDPADSSSIVITVRDPERIETREHDREQRLAVAYGRRGGWYLLRSKTRFAWLSPGDAGPFRSYPEFLQERVSYLTRGWDRTLFASPGGRVITRLAATSSRPPEDPREEFGERGVDPSDAMVMEMRQHAGDWWVRVRVGPSPCTTATEAPRGVADGWVPAYSSSGAPTLWFSPRGC